MEEEEVRVFILESALTNNLFGTMMSRIGRTSRRRNPLCNAKKRRRIVDSISATRVLEVKKYQSEPK